MTMTAVQKLAAGRMCLHKRQPYLLSALLGLVPQEQPGLGTIGVTKRFRLIYDPEFLKDVTPEEVAGLLAHEIGHLIQDHFGRFDRMGFTDMKLANIAGDLTINPNILKTGLKLPGGDKKGVFPEDYDLPEGLIMEEYYRALREMNDGQGPGEDQMPDSPQCGGGWCGSGGGRPLPDEPDDSSDGGGQPGQQPGNAPGIQKGLDKTDAEIDNIRKTVAHEIKKASQSMGQGAGGWSRWADDFLEPPKIPWQTKLARAARRAVQWRAGAVDFKFNGMNRKQAAIGFGPGKPILPRLRAPVPNVGIAIDTSGSMGQAELRTAVSESNSILKQVGADVTFLACDASVHGQVDKVRTIDELTARLKGGGGTSFIPVFETLEQEQDRPELLIFITDGMGSAPKFAPSWCETIWVLVGPYQEEPCDWGQMIHVDPNTGDEA